MFQTMSLSHKFWSKTKNKQPRKKFRKIKYPKGCHKMQNIIKD